MRRFRSRKFELEAELSRHRPQPRAELLASVRDEERATRPRRRLPALRVAIVATLVGALVAASAATGAFHYARHGFTHSVRHVNTHARYVTPAEVQYRPGCGNGDKNHVHTGPPGNHNGFPGTCPPNAGKK